MMYDFDDVLTFFHVARFNSFSKAANYLEISRAVVTIKINRLEEAMKMKLFVRTTREVNLTSDGVKFFDYCTPMINSFINIKDFVDRSQSIEGEMKIVLPPYFSRYHIVPHLDDFLEQYPKLKLNIHLTENPVKIISEGFDLQVRIQVPEEEDLETSILFVNTKLLCASKDYVATHNEIKHPRDLLDHNCIIFGENISWKFRNKITGEIVDLHDMKGNIKCDNGEIIKELVLAGIGVTVKSSCDVKNELESGEIVELLPEYEILHKTKFYAVYHAERANSVKIRAFIEFFAKKLL